MRWISLFALMLFAGAVKSQTTISVGVNTNIRALAAVDSNHWWFGGSNGWLGHTADGGKSWKLRQPAGSAVDFRSIHAFNQQEAVAAIAGQPAQIYRTHDGGKAWELVHWLKDTSAFIDAIGFWNAQDGLLFGDPLPDGRMLLLRTQDGGRSWEALPDSSRPQLYPGEAAFAASGTAMQCVGDSTVAIVSGGSRSRMFVSHNRGRTWEVQSIPHISSGEPSQGAFSLARLGHDNNWVLVGGDYRQEKHATGHNVIFQDGSWTLPMQATRGYRECVLSLPMEGWVATGPTGSDISWDGGMIWLPLNDISGMHVASAFKSNGLLLAGKGGKLVCYPILPKP